MIKDRALVKKSELNGIPIMIIHFLEKILFLKGKHSKNSIISLISLKFRKNDEKFFELPLDFFKKEFIIFYRKN